MNEMSRYVLITTTRCPKCPAIKKALLDSGLDMRVINELNEVEFPKFVSEYGLQEAPALIDLQDKVVVDYNTLL